jgi:hypothetical protein
MSDLKYQSVIAWIFYGTVAFLCARGINTLDKLDASVSALNVQSAIWISTTTQLEKQVTENSHRIREIELKIVQKNN